MITYQGYACVASADLRIRPPGVAGVTAVGAVTCGATCYARQATIGARLTPMGVLRCP
jgi:hypothetical protein